MTNTHPAACRACFVPEDHPLMESLSSAFGREFTHNEVQLMVSQLCAAHGHHPSDSGRSES